MKPYDIIQKLENGEINADRAYALLKEQEKEITEAIKQIQPQVFDYLGKYGKGELEEMGYRSVMRSTYLYAQSPMWKEMDEKKKEMEKLLKTATDTRKPFVDPDTGEMFEPVEVKYSASFQYFGNKS